jgi:signal transduction histidine kinase/DNA-binding response OmpR family regulator
LPKNGVATIEFNRLSHFQEADGTIYFGGLNGVTEFHPKDLLENGKDFASVVIADYEIFDGNIGELVPKLKEITESQIITFHPSDRFFKLKFVLPTSGDKSQTLYAWKIDGVFDDWTYQKENSLQFTSLPYGNHTLHIKGQSSAGWSPKELTLQIKVLKPFYLQTWFIVVCVGIVGLGLFLFYKRKTQELRLRQEVLETEIKKATNKIEVQSEKLRQLDKAKSRFFANISHEFRTPLTLILGPIKSALKRSKQLDISQMGLIERNGDELLRLINQILDLSKLEDGKMNVFYVQGDIIGFLQQTVERFKGYAEANEKQLLFQPSISALEMDYDKSKLQGILSNLIFNALKFTKKGDKIEIAIKQVDEQLYISIKDTGLGMMEEDIPRLFDRFHQIEKDQITTSSKGTGIGLALTKQLIDLMGGTIKVESRLGEGSQFTFNLPIRQEASQKDEDYQIVNAAMVNSLPTVLYSKNKDFISVLERIEDEKTVQVLIVEDTADLAQYIASCLPEHYQISFAENGLAGIQKAIEEVPDIIISDVMMPEKDGFELCQALKNETVTSHIPIILLTALAEAKARIKGLKRGADAYMSKPFEEEELQVRVTKLLELRKTLWKRFSQLASNPEASPTLEEQQNPNLAIEAAFITEIRDIVNEHYSDVEFNLQMLVHKIGMSERHLRRKLKALTGVSPNQFISSFRLEKAKELLLQTDLNISEIAFQIGFDSPQYFSRAFSKTHGISPRGFRKKN